MVSNKANGMLADFELAVARLLPACPVAAKVPRNTRILRYPV